MVVVIQWDGLILRLLLKSTKGLTQLTRQNESQKSLQMGFIGEDNKFTFTLTQIPGSYEIVFIPTSRISFKICIIPPYVLCICVKYLHTRCCRGSPTNSIVVDKLNKWHNLPKNHLNKVTPKQWELVLWNPDRNEPWLVQKLWQC